jgi:hypothetical protein
VGEAVDWLCETFGFTELWRAGGHRARVGFGNGVLILADADAQYRRAADRSAAASDEALRVRVSYDLEP